MTLQFLFALLLPLCTAKPLEFAGLDKNMDADDRTHSHREGNVFKINGNIDVSFSGSPVINDLSVGHQLDISLDEHKGHAHEHGGHTHKDDSTQGEVGYTQVQAIDGGWSEWSESSSCSATCGSASKMRERTCTEPAPANGGAQCSGSNQETADCALPNCDLGESQDILTDRINESEENLEAISELEAVLQHIMEMLNALSNARKKRSSDGQSSDETKLLELIDEVTNLVEQCGNGDSCNSVKMKDITEEIISTVKNIEETRTVSTSFENAFIAKKEILDKEISAAVKTQEEKKATALAALGSHISPDAETITAVTPGAATTPEAIIMEGATTTMAECPVDEMITSECMCGVNSCGSGSQCISIQTSMSTSGLFCISGCPTDETTSEECMCDGKICKKGWACTNGLTCNPVCKPMTGQGTPCICKSANDKQEEKCEEWQGCTQDGTCIDNCPPGEQNLETKCMCENQWRNRTVCTEGQICHHGMCLRRDPEPCSVVNCDATDAEQFCPIKCGQPLPNFCDKLVDCNISGSKEFCPIRCLQKDCGRGGPLDDDCICNGRPDGPQACRKGHHCQEGYGCICLDEETCDGSLIWIFWFG